MDRWLLPLLLVLTGAVVTAIYLHLPFANGPEEWEWAYREPGLQAPWLPVALAVVAVVLCWLPARGAFRRLRILLLVALGWGFTLALLAAQPGGLHRVVDSLVSRHTFSYVFDSGVGASSGALIRDYPTWSRDLSLHSRTHPPGPLLAIRALDLLGRRLQTWVEARGVEGLFATAARALRREVRRVKNRGLLVPPRLPSPATVVLLAYLLPALSAAAAWPLYRLARDQGLGEETALLAVLLWILVPARSLFTPSLDQALPLLLLLALWLAGSPSWWRWVLGGMALWLATFLSYGYLVTLPLVAAAVWPLPETPDRLHGRSRRGRFWFPLSAFLVAFVLLWLLFALLAHPPWSALALALGDHREMTLSSRGYGTWLLYNPYDFALLLGPPLAVLGATAPAAGRWAPGWRRLRPLFWTTAAVFLILVFSGSVRGEVGRIWMFLMPLAALFAALVPGFRWGLRSWRTGVVLGLQLLLSLVLAAHLVFVS